MLNVVTLTAFHTSNADHTVSMTSLAPQENKHLNLIKKKISQWPYELSYIELHKSECILLMNVNTKKIINNFL